MTTGRPGWHLNHRAKWQLTVKHIKAASLCVEPTILFAPRVKRETQTPTCSVQNNNFWLSRQMLIKSLTTILFLIYHPWGIKNDSLQKIIFAFRSSLAVFRWNDLFKILRNKNRRCLFQSSETLLNLTPAISSHRLFGATRWKLK